MFSKKARGLTKNNAVNENKNVVKNKNFAVSVSAFALKNSLAHCLVFHAPRFFYNAISDNVSDDFDAADDVFLTALAPVSFVFTMGGFRPFVFRLSLTGWRFCHYQCFCFCQLGGDFATIEKNQSNRK